MPEAFKVGLYIAVFILGFFLFRKKKPLPSKLDLSGFKGRVKSKSLGAIRKVEAEVVDEAPEQDSPHIFRFRAEKHDAFKVLGLPMGASIKEIKRAYQLKMLESPDSIELVGKAYEVLIQK